MLQSVGIRSVAITLTALAVGIASAAGAQGKVIKPSRAAGHFRVTSPDLVSKGRIALTHVFNGMGCNGQNISPALQWTGAPAGTK
ncbi:MAG TPA: hypothetical protein VIM36_11335, partial [Gemmatimonadaceae bacterium]